MSGARESPVRSRGMRWQRLFADLEGEADALARADVEAEIADRVRGELAQIAMLARFRGHVGSYVAVSIGLAGDLAGHLADVGANWLLLECPDEVVVPLSAVTASWDLPAHAIGDGLVSATASRRRLGYVIRAIARDRSEVRLVGRDGSELTGTPDRVGADFVDLAIHEPGAAPRRTNVRSRATVPFAAIGYLRRIGGGWQ